jgi:CheY-like chemotaxis protein
MKATTEGRITVKLEASADEKSVICKIIDTGRGIPAEIADKVFLPFVKGDAWTPGAGLGLNITQGLVNRMKGTVRLLSNSDRGMTFMVELPVGLRPSLAGDRPVMPCWIRQAIHRNMTVTEYTVASSGRILKTLVRSDSNVSASSGSGSNAESDSSQSEGLPVTPGLGPQATDSMDSRIRVLVVDDNDIGRKLAKRAIASPNVNIREANDGLQAFEVFRTFAPHLVLTDIGMPVDGITASKMMRNFETETNRPPARIYAITGLGATDSRMAKDGLQGEARLDGWLTKGKHGFEDFRKIVAETSSALGLGARPASPPPSRDDLVPTVESSTTATSSTAALPKSTAPAQQRCISPT